MPQALHLAVRGGPREERPPCPQKGAALGARAVCARWLVR
jgi:hypothetical protein